MSPLVFPTVNLKDRVSSLPVYFHGEEADPVVAMRKQDEFGLDGEAAAGEGEVEDEEASSSIGSASSSSSGSAHGEEEEVESKRKAGTLGSLDSLEDALPVKRGLSNFFTGKSKSFASLVDVAGVCANDVAKPENPLNKRRRVLMMSKMRRASYTSFLCPALPPLLSLAHAVEEADEEGEEEEEEEHKGGVLGSFPPLAGGGLVGKRPFRSPRSFSLSDLQRHA
ncbi:uncharacterized protein LOC122046036 [Zingiber officinale]|uniref:Uncharacterized protein n=1 Tax=Zingiber officinale TaxID=94328 RepID=A0A8J5HAS4_ZINOF|nr:uncharacterized protein LOC122046036 [Zingiber officinale]KAG6524485.1 hypothetical protein ZIOFF_014396 [Zingiber officinale]